MRDKKPYLKLILLVLVSIVLNRRADSFQLKLVKSVEDRPVELEILKSTPNAPRSVFKLNDDKLREIFVNETRKLHFDQGRTVATARAVDPELALNGTLNSFFTGHNDPAQIQGMKMAKVAMNAARTILEMNSYPSYDQAYTVLHSYKIPKDFCPYSNEPEPYCDYSYPYRTMDGSCNNMEFPWWGKSNTNFKRLLRPMYGDRVNEPRERSVTGSKLPNARLVAMAIHHPNNEKSHVTNLLPHYGQFIDHDITLTALMSDEEGTPIKCFCGNHDLDCFNIPTPKEDKLNFDQRCMIMPRSEPVIRHRNCRLSHREQKNKLTHWLDMSNVYGNDLKKAIELRSMMGGQLNSSIIRGIKRDYLPFTTDGSCTNIPEGKPCFLSGDVRTNQNVELIVLQTVWMREHNRVAAILQQLNPKWSDEKLYQVARKIVIAEHQHIIYNEWLPALVGEKVTKLYGLVPLNQDHFYKYDSKLYAHIMNEFSTAAMRHGHTLVRQTFVKVDSDYRPFEKVNLMQSVFQPVQAFKKGGLDSFLRGCLVDMAQAYDTNFNDYLLNHLFEGLNDKIPTKRFSLAALNIQRGREHGLASYVHYRHLCGLNYANSFDELYNMPKEVRERLAQMYDHVHDIDLYTGATAEYPIEGGVVGPTFACIIAKQFRDLKYGDRFFYEAGHSKKTGFTLRQLDEIRKYSLARLLCDNSDINYLQRNPFFKPDFQTNPLINCHHIASIDYSVWKEEYY